jgi:hypothetical protein
MRVFGPSGRFGVVGALLLLLSGCGGGGSPGTLYPVSGRVTVDGVPLPEAQLLFMAHAEKGNKTAELPLGQVKDGNYSVMTWGKPGAPPGWYKVRVKTSYPGSPEKPAALPARYFDAKTSPLAIEVVATPAPGAYDLKLTSQ